MIEHNYDFDPTYGYSKDDLLAIRAPESEPADFADFWRESYSEALTLDTTEVRLEEIWSPLPGYKYFKVFYKSLGGVMIGGWIARPEHGSVGGIVIGHGYGGALQPPYPLDWMEGFTVIMPCSRGFCLSSSTELPWVVHKHFLHNINSRDDYIIRGAVADLWRATGAMIKLFPDTAENLNYTGGSYGGGLGALAVPWDKRFKAAYLNVPTFGHHPLRAEFKSHGSGEAVRQYHFEHPEIMDTLRYFDASFAARYFEVPVICSPALFDPVVVTPGQFAVANSLPESLRKIFILPAGHFSVPENEPVLEEIKHECHKLFTGKS